MLLLMMPFYLCCFVNLKTSRFQLNHFSLFGSLLVGSTWICFYFLVQRKEAQGLGKLGNENLQVLGLKSTFIWIKSRFTGICLLIDICYAFFFLIRKQRQRQGTWKSRFLNYKRGYRRRMGSFKLQRLLLRRSHLHPSSWILSFLLLIN